MLTIGFDGTAVLRQQAGIGRYARELLHALANLDCDDQFRIMAAAGGAELTEPELGPRFDWKTVPLPDRVTNALWQRARLPVPVEIRLGRLDVFHCPDFSLPPSLAPSIVTIHDLAFELVPQVCVPSLAAYLHATVPRSVRRARAVIAPSEFTKRSLVERYRTDPEKIRVIVEGVTPDFRPEPEEADAELVGGLSPDDSFLFTAGTLEPRKNIGRLLRAFASVRSRFPDLVLAIAGARGWMDTGIFELHHELGLGEAVRFLGHVTDAELRALYRRAEIVVYVPLLEGFGLPPLEAIACGAPVIASGNSSIPEALGEAAVYVDPWDVEDMTNTIVGLLDDAAERRRLKDVGPAQAAKFTWKQAAETTSRLYHEIAGG